MLSVIVYLDYYDEPYLIKLYVLGLQFKCIWPIHYYGKVWLHEWHRISFYPQINFLSPIWQIMWFLHSSTPLHVVLSVSYPLVSGISMPKVSRVLHLIHSFLKVVKNLDMWPSGVKCTVGVPACMGELAVRICYLKKLNKLCCGYDEKRNCCCLNDVCIVCVFWCMYWWLYDMKLSSFMNLKPGKSQREGRKFESVSCRHGIIRSKHCLGFPLIGVFTADHTLWWRFNPLLIFVVVMKLWGLTWIIKLAFNCEWTLSEMLNTIHEIKCKWHHCVFFHFRIRF